jgi:hypothetical protein
MKRFKTLGMGALLSASLVGCSSAPSMMRALAKDPAIVVGRFGTPWGTEAFTRIGTTTNSVLISADGSVTINGQK